MSKSGNIKLEKSSVADRFKAAARIVFALNDAGALLLQAVQPVGRTAIRDVPTL
jgi:hypothetical protein